MTANGGVSFWWQQLGLPDPRPALPGDLDVDVAIVGAGYTGLWAAYYLKKAQPDLRVAVLERRFAGFGASGRNGGWLTNSVTGGRSQYVKTHGREAAIAQQRALNATVDEVIAVAAAEGIDAGIVKGGELEVARTPAQLARRVRSPKPSGPGPAPTSSCWTPRPRGPGSASPEFSARPGIRTAHGSIRRNSCTASPPSSSDSAS